MKWRLIKLLCIAGAGIVGILMTGEFLAAVLTAPFGWIVGRAMELNAEVRRMEREGTVYTPAVSGEVDEEWEEYYDVWDDYIHSPSYSLIEGNIFYDESD